MSADHDQLYSWDEVAAGLEQTAKELKSGPTGAGQSVTDIDDAEFADMDIELTDHALVQLRIWMEYLDRNDYWKRADASLMGAAEEIVTSGYSDGLPPTAVAIILYMGVGGH